MSRRRKPTALSVMERSSYLKTLGGMRESIIRSMSRLHPVGRDYEALAGFLSALDRHQEHFSGDPTYFHPKPTPSIGGRGGQGGDTSVG